MEWKQVEHIVRKEVDRQFRLGKTLDLKTLYKESFIGYTPQSEEKNLFGRKNAKSRLFPNNFKRKLKKKKLLSSRSSRSNGMK